MEWQLIEYVGSSGSATPINVSPEQGDGSCPNFFITRTNEKLVWEDSRTN